MTFARRPVRLSGGFGILNSGAAGPARRTNTGSFGSGFRIFDMAPGSLFTLPPIAPDLLTFPSRAVCIPLCFPDAVRNLPPRAVAPFPPMLVIRPALSRVSRFCPPLVLAALRAGLLLPPPPPDANRPRLSRLYVLAMAAALL